ncbi:hypothetical protein D7X74_16920 [Corallococcus sp. CA047B]|uniref:IPT/TIG domain-containing protein n=1 Tax=Corallococcus sp. CA047B TaxID=2316729 RepID=UPI000EA16079|nr:IPT/TIG domain-containing protein [Corallococcus sp. CA047B]RKH15946.1 hypothetical protein D7X74_16920 [Corallococcus sp. CA047B]
MSDVNQGWNLAVACDPTLISTGISRVFGNQPDITQRLDKDTTLTLRLSETTCAFDPAAGTLILNVPDTVTQGGQSTDGTVAIAVTLACLGMGCVYPDWYLSTTGAPGCGASPGGTWQLSGDSLTLETWLRMSTGGPQTLLSLASAGVSLGLEDDCLVLAWGSGRYASASLSNASLDDGRWHHVAVSANKGTLTFVVDGQPKGTAPLPSGLRASGSDLMLGAGLDGNLARVRIWNVARATPDLQMAMNVQVDPKSAGLVGDWTFSGGTVTNLHDNHTGSLQGGAATVPSTAKDAPLEDQQAQSYLWFFDPEHTFTVSVTPPSDAAPRIASAVRALLMGMTVAAKPLSTMEPSDSMPTTGVFTQPHSPDTGLVLLAMGRNTLPPRWPAPKAIAPDADLATSATQNTTLSLDDDFVLALMLPQVATSLSIPASDLRVAGTPPVLSLVKPVDATTLQGKHFHLTTLTMSLTPAKGVSFSLRGTASHMVIKTSGIYTLTVKDNKEGKPGLYHDILDPKVSITPNPDDPAVQTIQALSSGFSLAAIVAGIIAAVYLSAASRAQSATLGLLQGKEGFPKDPPDLQDFTLQGVAFVAGLLVHGQFIPSGGTLSTSPSRSASQGPVITGFTPQGGAPGTQVTVTGSGFTGVRGVKFGDTLASYVRCWSDQQLVARVADGSTSGPLQVMTPAGTATSSASFAVTPAPTLQSVSPASAEAGATVTLRGEDLDSTTAVYFSEDLPAPIVARSQGQLTARVPPGAVSGPITVVTPSGRATVAGFTAVSSAPPTLGTFEPPSGLEGTEVTVTGSGFTGTRGVTFNGTPASSITVLSDTQLVAAVGPRTTSGPIGITNTRGSGASSRPFQLQTPPQLTHFSPTQGAPGTTVTLHGTGLGGTTAVHLGAPGVEVPLLSVSDTQLTVTSPGGTASGPICAQTPAGTARTEQSFTVLSTAVPVIASFSPANGGRGTAVTLTGSGFTGTTRVRFDGVDAAGFEVDSDTTLTAYVLAKAQSGLISVTNTRGTQKTTQSFHFVAPPGLKTMTPASGKAGDAVTLGGTGLTDATSVRFGDLSTAEAPISVKGDSLVVTVPPGAVTGPVHVTTPGGQVRSTVTFTVAPGARPTVTGFTPATGGAGTEVTLTGSGFTATTGVRIGDVPAARYEVHSDTQLVAVVANDTMTGSVSVTNGAGTGGSEAPFTVPVSVTGFTPTSGPAGTEVRIEGQGFTNTRRVSFGDSAMPASFTVRSDTGLTAWVPSGAVGGHVQVATEDAVTTSSTDFHVESSAPPEVQGFSPTAGPPGTRVTVDGAGFTGATDVSLGGVSLKHFQVLSDAQLTFTVPPGAASGVIQVTNTLPTPGSSKGGFQVTSVTTSAPARAAS